MSDTKFTPGPWSIHSCDEDRPVIVVENENGQPQFETNQRTVVAGGTVLAEVNMYRPTGGRELGFPAVASNDEMIGNAHLIATSPELYEALRMAAKDLHTAAHFLPDTGLALLKTVKQAHAALAKARGEA